MRRYKIRPINRWPVVFLFLALIFFVQTEGGTAQAVPLKKNLNEKSIKSSSVLTAAQSALPKKAQVSAKSTPVETVELKKNKRGKVDRWLYRKDGLVYKREYDRNGDGKPDFRVVEDHGRFIQKEYDLKYDGTFDKIEKAEPRGSSGRIKTAANGNETRS